MATEPTNALVRVAELDTTLPIAGGANKIEPESLILTTGYDDDQAVFAQDLNYIFDNLAQWINYSQERIDELISQVEKERVSVGEIIEITGDSTNPSVLKGYGTWESFGEGQVLVGVGEHTDDRSESKTWVDGDSEGEYKHVQTEAELGKHNHPDDISASASSDGLHNHSLPSRDNSDNGNWYVEDAGDSGATRTANTGDAGIHSHTITVFGGVQDTGDSSPMNNIQPSLAVYRWKRTA